LENCQLFREIFVIIAPVGVCSLVGSKSYTKNRNFIFDHFGIGTLLLKIAGLYTLNHTQDIPQKNTDKKFASNNVRYNATQKTYGNTSYTIPSLIKIRSELS